MQTVEHHDAELVHGSLRKWNTQPVWLGMKESRQASVELVGNADHTTKQRTLRRSYLEAIYSTRWARDLGGL